MKIHQLTPTLTRSTQQRTAAGPERPRDTFVRSEGYAPKGEFLWDCWTLFDEGQYTLFHLSAPQDPDPETRHHRAQVRTAVSTDLKNWTDTGFALESGPEGSWDDGPIWTGSTYKENGNYYMFYTARNQRDGQTQRIGLATSSDGVNWKRGEKPLLEADSRWYETDEPSPVYRAFRDPHVVKDPESGKYLMYFTAKTKDGHERYRGCIGLAVADKLDGPYEMKPPVLAPGHYAEMEVPQVIERDGKWHLFFTTKGENYHPDLSARLGGPQTGLHGFVGDSPTGPFEPIGGHGVVAGDDSNMFAIHLMPDQKRPGEYEAIGWFMKDRQVRVDASRIAQARGLANSAGAAAVGGVAGMGIEVLEKAYTLSEPYPVVWDETGVRIETGRVTKH